MTKTFRLTAGVSAIALAWTGLAAVPAAAQDAPTTATPDGAYAFSIPAQSLGDALRAFASTADVQLAYSAELIAGKTSSALSGSYSVRDGLMRLLAGTGLTFRAVDGRTFSLESLVDGDGARILGSVRVEGAQGGSPYFGGAGQMAGVNGVNGSQDITATEGTGSFTSGALTIGSKAPKALKDVPQSLSVITSERMEQQNITDFTSAMKYAPGITLVQGNQFGDPGTNLETTFYSRGFPVTSIQIDGGAPLSTVATHFDAQNDLGYLTLFDMAQYDHIEVLRGAAGTFNGYGNPSGSINLVRKKPLDHGQVVVEAQAGSWSNYRLVLDVSSPLAFDGKLRGRLVTTYQDNDYFYDLAHDNKVLVYGIAEFDLTPTTLITAGVSHNRQDSLPWYGGLPRYENGDDLMLPRSTSFAFPWNYTKTKTTEIFGSIEQRIGTEWRAKLNLTHNKQSTRQKYGASYGTVDPVDKDGPVLTASVADTGATQFSAELTVNGAFTIFGQRQEILVGANHSFTDGDGRLNYTSPFSGTGNAENPYQPYPGGPIFCGSGTGCPPGSIRSYSPTIDVFNFDPNNLWYVEPGGSLPAYRYPKHGQTTDGLYAAFRFTAFDRLHLDTALRYSRYHHVRHVVGLCVDSDFGCDVFGIGNPWIEQTIDNQGEDFTWPPPINLSFDVTGALTVYAGYTDIYITQDSSYTGDLQPLDPITGSNVELGLKWAPSNGRFNAAIAVYRIKQKNFAIQEPNIFDRIKLNPDGSWYMDSQGRYYIITNDGTELPNGQVGDFGGCCFLPNSDRELISKGVDVEVTGEILRGLQVAAGYTYNHNEQKGSWYGAASGNPIVSRQPAHLLKGWLSYDFGAAGADSSKWYSRLNFSGGFNWQSSAYYAGEACTEFVETTGPNGQIISNCAPDKLVAYDFIQGSYAVFSARIDYRLTDNVALAVNVDNLLDTRYYQTAGSSTGGNWYGAPRSLTVSLRGKW